MFKNVCFRRMYSLIHFDFRKDLRQSKALKLMGDSLHHMNNFEHALVYYYRKINSCFLKENNLYW